MPPQARQASHAGSWYPSDSRKLDSQLTDWLQAVSSVPKALDACVEVATPDTLNLPVQGCRAIIAPHAGYSYSGPAAAYAYRCIDPSAIRRVFVLGPSHHFYLDGCAVSRCDTYQTPIGDLPIDKSTTEELRKTGHFSEMDRDTDEDEHSLEMHLPYIRKVFEKQDVQIVPILVGAISTAKEHKFGELLAKYLAAPDNLFVVSSDFCHWGSRFNYTYYRDDASSDATSLTSRSPSSVYANTTIHESIRRLDEQGVLAITHPHSTSTSKTALEARDQFSAYLKKTKNTVCGRHPIGVLLSALAHLEQTAETKTECRFTRYEQSSPCLSPRDSSVSYASAYVTLHN